LTIRRVIVAVVAVIAIAWIARAWWPSEERRIRARLDALAEEVSTPAGNMEDALARMARAVRIGSFFTEAAAIEAGPPYPALRGRDTIVGAASSVGAQEVTLEFVDVQVGVAAGQQAASAYMTAKAAGLDRAGGRGLDASEVEMDFRKVDGRWLIAAARVRRTLE